MAIMALDRPLAADELDDPIFAGIPRTPRPAVLAGVVQCAVYLRMSKADKVKDALVGRDTLGIQRQASEVLPLVERKGWAPVLYIDNNVSASKERGEDTDYRRMLRDIEAGLIGAVAVWDMDRLHRLPRELEGFIDLVEKYGTKLANVTGDVDLSTHNGRLYARIKGAVGRGEMEQKSARQKLAARQRAENGIVRGFGMERTFGWEDDGLTLCPDEALAIQDACASVIAGGSLLGICREWTRLGIRPARGAERWWPTAVKRILTNARIAGLSTYKGEVVGNGEWQNIVKLETWEAVCAALNDPSRKRGKGVRTLLGGIVRCRCGAPMVHGKTKAGTSRYSCRDRNTGGARFDGERQGPHVARRADDLDEFVVRALLANLNEPGRADELVPDKSEKVIELRAQAATHRARLDDLAMAFAEGDLTREQHKAGKVRIAEKLAVIETELNDVMATSAAAPLLAVADPADVGPMQAVWDKLDLDAKRAILRSLMEITVYPSTKAGRGTFNAADVTITWKADA